MDYHIITKPSVDSILINVITPFGLKFASKMNCIEEDDIKIFNGKLPPVAKNEVLFELLSGSGEAECNINDLISETITTEKIKQGNFTTPFIVNTPRVIKLVLAEFPHDIVKNLGLPRSFKLVPIDIQEMKKKGIKKIQDFLARGIDPAGKSWMGHVLVNIPEWGKRDPARFCEFINKKTLPVKIICFASKRELTGDEI